MREKRQGHTVKALPLLVSTEVADIGSSVLILLHSLALAEVYLEIGKTKGKDGRRLDRILHHIRYHVGFYSLLSG